MKKIILPFVILLFGLTGICQNPLLLKDVYPGATGSGILEIVKTSNYTFFNAEDDDLDADRGLYRTDGTPGGTIKLNLTYPTYASTKADKLTVLGDKIIFAGDNFSPGYGEIWASDGTQAGTIALERFQPSVSNRGPVFELAAMNGYVYYGVVANNNKTQIKRTDGTPGGTSLVYEFSSYTTAPEPGLFKVINGILYFNMYDQEGAGNDMVWRSDGTTAGTYQLRDMGTDYFLMGYFMSVGSNICFMTGKFSNNNSVLFKTDGTAAGTVPVYEFASVYNNNLYPAFAKIGNTLYFAAHDGTNGKELWKTDGTAGGTVPVADINTGAASSNPTGLVVLNNQLYFAAANVASGNELWKYDGINASLVKDINPGTANSTPGSLVVSNNNILFRAFSSTNGTELWITDGSAANTVQVTDINPGTANAAPNLLTPGNPVYFSANNGVNGVEIFTYNNSQGISGLHKLYVNDNSTSGDIYTTAVGNNANAGTSAAPVATITYALSIAQAGDTIMVDAGTFTEQVTIDKGITIAGVGRNLTSILKPTATFPPPGPFTEQGVIQTAPNIGDVHIKDLSVTGDFTVNVTSIILQTGGSVKNCNLQNGNQGIFFRVDPAVKIAVVENNIISAEYIGVNFSGTGLTASLINNEISTANAGFSAGVFFGLDFGNLPQCTMANNKFISYSTYGVFGGSNNATFFENSFTGSGSAAIYSFSNATATCNWFGTDDAEVVKSKITGPVSYAPWLVNGTDMNPAVIGFQPAPGTCTGRQNKFYVNDNSQTGDVFTTAVGNNANNGFSISPFATINYAISVAQAGDTIIVDAGTYVENVIANKSLTLRGAKYGLHPGASLDRGNETIIVPATTNVALTGSVMKATADNITIDGFLLDGDNPNLSGGTLVNGIDANAGAGVFNDNLYINNLTVINNIVKNTAAYGIGQAKNASAPAATGALFRYNRVDNALSRGLALNFNSYGSIMDNYVTRCNNGIWVANSSTPNPAGTHVIVSGNTVNAISLGMQASVVNGAAPIVDFLNNDVTVSNTGYGISVIGGTSSGIFASNNKISGCLSSVLTNLTAAVSPVIFNNNSFTGYASQSFETYNGLSINGTCNWYGTNSSAAIQASVLGNVNFTPWLVNGTDNDPAIGFQPVANACLGQPKYYVNDNSLTGDVFTTAVGSNTNNGSPSSPFTTPDYAYSIAQAGDTIYVDAGTYNLGGLTYSFPKAIVLLGTNYQVSPNDPSNKLLLNTARNAESILTNGKMLIASSGLSIEGFTWDVGNRTGVELANTAATNNDFGNLKFAKNIFKIAHTTANLNSFAITGKFVTSPALPVTTGYTILDNRFEKSGSATGNTLNFNYVKNISVSDNSFVVTGTTLKTQQAANIAGTGIVDGLIFSNNLVDEASTAFGGNRIAGAVITGNKIHNAGTSFGNTNSIPESSNIEFSNNELGSDLGSPFMLYNRTGVSLAGTSNIFKVENNIITGVSEAASVLLFAAMNLTFSNTALNPSFIIRGNKITYSGDFSSVASQFFRPITVRGNIANVTLENNELTLNNTGGLGAVVPATLLPANPAFSIITDNGATSYMPSNAIINVLNNKIHGYKQSVVFYDVANAGHDTYAGYGNIPAGATVNVLNNSFTGDDVSINNGEVGQSINATCNWYGSSAAQTVLTKITASSVNYVPWLTNGTDNDLATGFQPLAGSCNGTSVVAVVTQATNITCNGANNGSINVTISGGSTPYSFAWSKDNVAGFSNTEDLINLAPGVYQLIVTDANGSVHTVTATITQPAVLTASATGTNASCFGNSNGTATVTATGGTAPYTYLWSNAATTNSISGLVAGNYSVTVTDANGCATTASYTVTQPTALTVVMSGTNASCNGSATATPAGGTAPYIYLWSNSAITQTISGVPNGTYTVVVTDAHNCTVSGTRIINGNSPINPTTLLVHVSCFGGSDGSITVTGAGGTAPHTYSINGSAYQSSNVFANLTAGVYVVSAKDASGCYDFVTRTITQSPLLTVVLDSVKAACFGTNNGRIYITAGGGSGAKTYSWTGPNGYISNTRNPNNLFAGTYNLLVTDAKGCTASLVVIVVARPAITISEVITHVGCRGDFTGAINATVSGGSGLGFIYKWTGPNGFLVSTEDITGIKAGNYTFTVTDMENGCAVVKVIVVTQPATNLGLATAKTNATGCNSLGTITATGSGGTGPYQYKLDNGSYQSSGLFTNLFGASYTVWVRDVNGCTTSKLVTITDNGSDQYEGNNNKNQAKAINISAVVNARIAVANDAADWFKFITPAGTGNYILSLTHPSVAFTFNIFPPANNAPPLVPISTTSTSKEYVLSGNTTYYISITGGLSYTCYELMVAPPTSFTRTITPAITTTDNGNSTIIEKDKPVVIEIADLYVKAFPNPHQGSFSLQIASPEAGTAKIELFTITGQKLQEKTVSVQKGESNIVPLLVTQHGTIFYRIQIGKYIANGKVIGTN